MPRSAAQPSLLEPDSGTQPLAERLRPSRLDQVVGQDPLLGPDGALTRMVQRGSLASLILWGPPGVGKTTIARLLAAAAGLHFVSLSAVFSGVADLKRVFEAARHRREAGERTLLFVDEVHRFNRAQQDGFLPVVEDGTIVLVGATTENPSFALNGALLSRCMVLVLQPLDDAALEGLLQRAEAEMGRKLPLSPAARAAMLALVGGDGRYLLNLAEQMLAAPAEEELDVAAMGLVLQRRAASHDKAGDLHYDLLSAFHKSLRGSSPDAALYYAARLMVGGEAPEAVFRRLLCAASEDVGTADPDAMLQVIGAWDAFERVGWPEGKLFMAQAICYVATAPKSNAAYLAFAAALDLAGKTAHLRPPLNILNAPTRMMKELGYHKGYRYDHDAPNAFAANDFFPGEIGQPAFYQPNERGFEREIAKRLAFWAKLRSEDDDA